MAEHRRHESWARNSAAAFSVSPDSVFDVSLKLPRQSSAREEPLARGDNTINSNKGLPALPNELLLNIGNLLLPGSLSSFARTCQRINAVCNPRLYRRYDEWVSHWGATYDREDTIGRVIEYAKDAEGMYHFNSILLPTAAARGNEDLVMLLISKGADVNQPNILGQTALAEAMEYEQLKMVILLLQQEGIDLTDETNDIPVFQVAITRGHYVVVDRLLQCRAFRDARINTRFPYSSGLTPLGTAAEYGFDEILKLLISYGADINQDTGYGMTALAVAIEGNKFAIVDRLLQCRAYRDAHINTPFPYSGMTPLFAAAGFGFDKIVKLLIRHGADINQDTGYGRFCDLLRLHGIYWANSASVTSS